MDDLTLEALTALFREHSDECRECPFFVEWGERPFWLDYEPEGRVMCRLIGGAGGEPEDVCVLWQHRNEL